MNLKRGKYGKPIPVETKNKMVTVRMDGELYNALLRLSKRKKIAMNQIVLDMLNRNVDIIGCKLLNRELA